MGLTLISQPAQALTWDFSFDATNNMNDQMTFSGTLTTDGTAVVPDQIYNVTGASGSLFYKNTLTTIGNTFTNLTASGNFKWDGTQQLLNYSDGILFSVNDITGSGPVGRIFCNTTLNCGLFGNYGSEDFMVNAPLDNTGAPDLTVNSSSMSPATPVPWETDALPVIATTLLFLGGVWAKRKLAKPFNND